jgi:hypothetical protein
MSRALMVCATLLVSCEVNLAADIPMSPPLRIGMSPEEVRAALEGPPRKVARQVMHGHYHEVWYYEKPHSLWIEFDCRKGREGRVITVHPEIRPKP